MAWPIKMLRSSVGKKLLMAITGFGLYIFLLIHFAGNLTIYNGKDSFNTYSEHIHSFKILIILAEIGLFVIGLTHIITGLTLFIDNIKSRPIKYIVNKKIKERTISAITMPYTGIILFVFIIIHLFNLQFISEPNTSAFQTIKNIFSNFGYIFLYIFAIITVSLHINHGFWSIFQSIGLNYTKYMKTIKFVGSLFATTIVLGFGFIPIYIFMLP